MKSREDRESSALSVTSSGWEEECDQWWLGGGRHEVLVEGSRV